MRTLFPRASWIAAARSALAVVLAGLASAAMAQVPAVDWKAERAEILRHYRALVQIDTSNPGPASTESDNINYGAHSDVERLLDSSLYDFVEFTWSAVTDVAAKEVRK